MRRKTGKAPPRSKKGPEAKPPGAAAGRRRIGPDGEPAEDGPHADKRELQQVVDHIPVMIVFVAPSGRTEWVNREWTRVLGWSVDQIRTGEPLLRMYPDPVERDMVLQFALNPTGEWRDFRTRTRSGQVLDTSWANIPLSDGSIIGIGIDISQRKAAEDTLRRFHASLAHAARVSTVSEMASSLAHELTQPLTAIAGYAAGCLERLDNGEADPAELREAIERISIYAEETRESIDRVRRFLHKGGAERAELNPNDCITEAVALVQDSVRTKDAAVLVDLAPQMATILGNRTEMHQVIVNLLRNAIDAVSLKQSSSGAVTLRSRIDPEHVEIVVEDSGIGLPPGFEEKVFEPYYTTKPNGLGMGLTISRSIVETHGGRLWAESREGEGATFRFTLPQAGRRPWEER